MSGAGDVWGTGDYERVFEFFTGMPRLHDHLLRCLAPRPRERWLDVATGTGRVARAVARAGAGVTAQDESPGMLEIARTLAARDGVSINFDRGDCRELPYADASFDVVCSAVGATLAPGHRAVAAELARVCRPGGRLGLVAWRPDTDFPQLFGPASTPEDETHWGREDDVGKLLASAFELEFDEGEAEITGESGAAIWEAWVAAVGPTRRYLETLQPNLREQLRRSVIEYFESFRVAGGIRQPNAYLLILGGRR